MTAVLYYISYSNQMLYIHFLESRNIEKIGLVSAYLVDTIVSFVQLIYIYIHIVQHR